MEIRSATMEDLDGLLALHRRYHVDSIDPALKPDGFVTTNFTPEQLKELVERERGITIAMQNGVVVSYAMAASWQFWSAWSLFAHMIEKLPHSSFMGQPLTVENSYQYGPICADCSVRGTGLFEQVFYASLQSMSKRYPIMATFINQINDRSYAAHTKKVGMQTVDTFRFNGNNYYTLACSTQRL